jgi:hypothetical protein
MASTVKRISSNYILNNFDPSGGTANITIRTNTLFIDGNLQVGGNSTLVHKTDAYITDNMIELNYGDPGPGVTLGTSGIQVDRGSLANVQIRWNESVKHWELTNDGTSYSQIITSGGTFLTNVYADSAPAISANLDLRSHAIYDSTVPLVSANIGTVSSGSSGVYVNNSLGIDELITRKKSLIYNNLL